MKIKKKLFSFSVYINLDHSSTDKRQLLEICFDNIPFSILRNLSYTQTSIMKNTLIRLFPGGVCYSGYNIILTVHCINLRNKKLHSFRRNLRPESTSIMTTEGP